MIFFAKENFTRIQTHLNENPGLLRMGANFAGWLNKQ